MRQHTSIAADAGNSQPAQQNQKILGIELLRFLSSIAVLVFHYQHFAYRGATPVDFSVSQQPLYAYLSLFYVNGFYGVQVFWCISGFIFFWKYGRSIAASTTSGYVFFILRLSRLYPLHFVTLLFMAAMQAAYFHKNGYYFVYQANSLHNFILHLFMASNWDPNLPESFNGPIWSISIEVLVYAAFFLSLRYISASPVFIGAVALTAALVQVRQLSTHPLVVCMMFFYLGCLTAIVYQRTAQCLRLKGWATAGALLVTVALPVLAHIVTIKPKYFLVLFTPALIYLCVTYIPTCRFTLKMLVPAGNMTYASYLLHIPLQISVVFFCTSVGFTIPFYDPKFLLAFIGVILLLSHWVYQYVEMPAQTQLRRWLSRKS